jgi:hypothetical protein
MLRRRKSLLSLAALLVGGLVLSATTLRGKPGAGTTPEIKFDLGKNIHDAAQASGAPRFQKSETAGLVDYSIAAVLDAVPAHYTRAGYEIVWAPIFAFTMYADRDQGADLRVQTVHLQLDNKIKTHEEAQAFVEQTLAQFQKGKWQRYYNPVWDTLLTGRSSFLNEKGEIRGVPMAIDPAYKILPTEWPVLVKKNPTWRWVGDGVLASLEVSELGNAERGLDYRMNLEFELLDIKLKVDAENEARELKQGDAKGWNITARLEREKKERAELNKRLEANAIQRGDSVVTKP